MFETRKPLIAFLGAVPLAAQPVRYTVTILAV